MAQKSNVTMRDDS